MSEYEKNPIKIVTSIFLIIGLLGTLFSIVLFIIGGKAKGVVTVRESIVAKYRQPT